MGTDKEMAPRKHNNHSMEGTFNGKSVWGLAKLFILVVLFSEAGVWSWRYFRVSSTDHIEPYLRDTWVVAGLLFFLIAGVVLWRQDRAKRS